MCGSKMATTIGDRIKQSQMMRGRIPPVAPVAPKPKGSIYAKLSDGYGRQILEKP